MTLSKSHAGENKPIRVWLTIKYEADTANRNLLYGLPFLPKFHVAALGSMFVCLLHLLETRPVLGLVGNLPHNRKSGWGAWSISTRSRPRPRAPVVHHLQFGWHPIKNLADKLWRARLRLSVWR